MYEAVGSPDESIFNTQQDDDKIAPMEGVDEGSPNNDGNDGADETHEPQPASTMNNKTTAPGSSLWVSYIKRMAAFFDVDTFNSFLLTDYNVQNKTIPTIFKTNEGTFEKRLVPAERASTEESRAQFPDGCIVFAISYEDFRKIWPPLPNSVWGEDEIQFTLKREFYQAGHRSVMTSSVDKNHELHGLFLRVNAYLEKGSAEHHRMVQAAYWKMGKCNVIRPGNNPNCVSYLPDHALVLADKIRNSGGICNQKLTDQLERFEAMHLIYVQGTNEVPSTLNETTALRNANHITIFREVVRWMALDLSQKQLEDIVGTTLKAEGTHKLTAHIEGYLKEVPRTRV